MTKYSLLSKANKINFSSKPFPHLIIENALPEEYYNLISSKFPINYFESIKIENENNVRKDLFSNHILNEKNIDKEWVNFISYHSSKDFLNEIVPFFSSEILNLYQKKIKNINYLLDLETNNRLSTSVNTPVITSSSVRGAHLDNLNKLFTGLFYMKYDDDNSSGGDLDLFSWKKNYSTARKRFLSKKDISMDHVVLEKTIKYKPNTFVIILNSLDSLHGVTPRSITNHYRRMCVFTSVLPFSLDTSSILDRIELKMISYINR